VLSVRVRRLIGRVVLWGCALFVGYVLYLVLYVVYVVLRARGRAGRGQKAWKHDD
jgi:hypothetical protein